MTEPPDIDRAARALCDKWLATQLREPEHIARFVGFDAITEDGREVWRDMARTVAAELRTVDIAAMPHSTYCDLVMHPSGFGFTGYVCSCVTSMVLKAVGVRIEEPS